MLPSCGENSPNIASSQRLVRILFDAWRLSSTFVDFSPRLLLVEGAVIRFKLGEQLEKKQFRDSRRITLQEVSDATAINRSTLSKILNQRGYSTGTDIVDKLCTYFGCTVSDLLEYVPD